MQRITVVVFAFVLLLAGIGPSTVHGAPLLAQGPSNPALALKTAAAAWIAQVAPGVVVDRIEISGVSGAYATVIVYPEPGTTDPATVVMQEGDGVWAVIAGPGTAFPPGASRAGAPDGLFDFTNPYTGDEGMASLADLGAAPIPYQGADFTFQYPGDGAVGPGPDTSPGSVQVTGPIQAPPFNLPAYEITVAPLAEAPSIPFDEWGYDEMLSQIAQRRAEGGPASTFTPLTARFYRIGDTQVFQIDWFAGDSTLRDFYVEPQASGPILAVNTRVYPVENNPAAPLARAAVTLLLQSLATPPPTSAQAPATAP